MEVSELKLRPGKPPPPPAPARRAREGTAKRARQAIRILERHQFVTDRQGYPTRPSAIGMARRLIDALEKHEGVPRSQLKRRVWLARDGWHWQLELRRDA